MIPWPRVRRLKAEEKHLKIFLSPTCYEFPKGEKPVKMLLTLRKSSR